VSLALDDFCDAIDPDPAWLPGTKRFEFVDNEGHLAVACHNIFVFAGGLQPVTANVEARTIELEANGINGGLPSTVRSSNPGKGVAIAEKPVLARKT